MVSPLSPQRLMTSEMENALLEKDAALRRNFDETALDPFVVMMPPPNVTGSLHLGHALNQTLQDILVRYWRNRGRSVLWQPGLDHAGIAAQMIVESHLASQGKDRVKLGRSEFLKHMWAWKEASGGRIVEQLKRLGISAQWDRLSFTLDPSFQKSVHTAFQRLYRDGLIFKDKRLINWDPKLQTAVSDLEVKHKATSTHLYILRYYHYGTDHFIPVATTRPETLFGDTAVAVHPGDSRYHHWIGKRVRVPLTDRDVPVIADEIAQPDKGTGALKITPAHNSQDFKVGLAHGLDMITVIDEKGCLSAPTPEAFVGMDCLKARKAIMQLLIGQGLANKEHETTQSLLPYGDRSGALIESRLSSQWFLNTKPLAQKALEVFHQNKISFTPSTWANTYVAWLERIEPWCLSRQLWWGHRIPIWTGPDGQQHALDWQENPSDSSFKLYGDRTALVQDPDVLDTWFSSALWPFATLGWPDETPLLKRAYPGNVLVTGFDILFFWVARMVMMGCYFMKDVPFRTVMIHSLVRDENGEKMSKTKGNVLDPLDLVDDYGVDALRWTLARLSAPGHDIALSRHELGVSRNFVTKMWNAYVFNAHYGCNLKNPPSTLKSPLNQWMLTCLHKGNQIYDDYLEDHNSYQAAGVIRQLFRDIYCDWFIEWAKADLQHTTCDDLSKAKVEETRYVAAYVLGRLVTLLNPLVPLISLRILEAMGKPEGVTELPMLAFSAHPEYEEGYKSLEWVKECIELLRRLRQDHGWGPKAPLRLYVTSERYEALKDAGDSWVYLTSLGYVAAIITGEDLIKVPSFHSVGLVKDEHVSVWAEGKGDQQRDRGRLVKELSQAHDDLEYLLALVTNSDFVARAPAERVAEKKQALLEKRQSIATLQKALDHLDRLSDKVGVE